MPASPSSLRFPSSRVLLPRTRLAYIHLRNLLTDAKRDRAARISGYVAISLPEELIVLYLIEGEAVNAAVRDARGSRAMAIVRAIEAVPSEPEYGEICFCEADEEQLICMFLTQSGTSDPWPDGLVAGDPTALFPYLMSTTFDGIVEVIEGDEVNYLVFRNGVVARTFLFGAQRGSVVDRVAKLFSRDGDGEAPRVTRWPAPIPFPSLLPLQAPPALVQAYRGLIGTFIQRLVDRGRETAPAIAEHVRLNLLEAHPVLSGFSFTGQPVTDPVADTRALTSAIAALIRDVMWAAVDHDADSPNELIRELTWERRHMYQSAGLYEQIPWKVI